MKALRASHILSICDHADLAESRELVLRHPGYSVHSTQSDADLTEWSHAPIELVLLCHTIEQNRQRELIRRLRRTFPEARIISIAQFAERQDPLVDVQCSVEDGPEGMLKCVEDVLGQVQIAPQLSA